MENTFPGFKHKAEELSTYLLARGNFAIALNTKMVIIHTPTDVAAFHHWLHSHHITDITDDAGTMVLELYANKT